MGQYADLNQALRNIYQHELKKSPAKTAVDELVFNVVSALKNTVQGESGFPIYEEEEIVDELVEEALLLARRNAYIDEQT